jgi:hypothetical protein
MACTLVLGLLADAGAGPERQLLIGAAFWLVLFHLCSRVEPRERRALVACLGVATAGELFLSLGWGVYAYRLQNVPLFVPPGHVLMYLLAAAMVRRLTETGAKAIIGGAGLYAAVAAALGLDTFALPLFAGLGVAAVLLPRERRLLAATMVLSLALELYGTGLGIWTWEPDVPFTGLVTTNPPALSGALYVVRDALVAGSAVLAARRALAAPAPLSGD